MKNIYLLLYSKFYYFTLAINKKNKSYASIVAVAMFSGYPILNIMVLLTNVFHLHYDEYKKAYLISFIILYLINFILFVIINGYEKIEANYAISQKSKKVSILIVIAYILLTFVSLFI
jgi:hypothetical protein